MINKKFVYKNLVVGALVFTTLIGTVGCVSKTVEGKELVKTENKTITVIKDTKNIMSDEFVISDIVEYKGVIGYDWIDESAVIGIKEDDKLKQIETEVGNFNVQSLFVYDLTSKEEKAVSDQSVYQNGATLSPNKKYMFYSKQFVGEKKGYISDVRGNIILEISDSAIGEYDLTQASWINNDELIMPCTSIKGFEIANIDGTVTKIKDVESGVRGTEDPLYGLSMLKPIKVENKIYYVTINSGKEADHKLNVYDIDTKENKVLIEDDVYEFSLSPNKTQLLILTIGEQGENVLVTTDLEGNQKEILATGYIFGQTWSNEGTKVTYIAYEEGKEGVNVIDVNTKANTKIVEGQYYEPIKWSPSDERIMVHSIESKNTDRLFDEIDVTSIISLK